MKKLIYALLFLPALLGSCASEESISIPDYTPMNYSFKWKSYEADATTDYEWCMTRSNKYVAFTDYDAQTQFMVKWDGGMGDGEKEEATVSLTRKGNEPLVYKIAYFNLTKQGDNCTIDFLTSDGSEGVVHFPL